MSEQIREILQRFDDLVDKAQTPEAKILVEAIKLQTQLINLRLAVLEHLPAVSALSKPRP